VWSKWWFVVVSFQTIWIIIFSSPIGFWFDGCRRRSYSTGLCVKTSDTARISSEVKLDHKGHHWWKFQTSDQRLDWRNLFMILNIYLKWPNRGQNSTVCTWLYLEKPETLNFLFFMEKEKALTSTEKNMWGALLCWFIMASWEPLRTEAVQ